MTNGCQARGLSHAQEMRLEFEIKLIRAFMITTAIYGLLTWVYCVLARFLLASWSFNAPFVEALPWIGTGLEVMISSFLLSSLGCLIYLIMRD